ncbi:SH3 domain-containing protein [Arabiibacter massiliensis]|uniref:SH3 domain-containing protein n=1 Tax=Arabiibacter massiliensis TaxID=1870985 RepID=UPI0009BBA8A4|nr:SH3 domain-containing protein [Arabiibacter massiliensis]
MKLKDIARLAFGTVGGAIVLTTAIAVPCAFAEEGVTTMATTAPLNLRDGASIDANIVTTMPQGTSVQVFGMTADGWYDVEYDGRRGHCWYQYLNFEGTAEGTVHDGHVTDMYATAPLNVRAQPNTGAQIYGSLAEGQYVPVISKHDGWFKVSFNGQEAYCYGEYLGFGQTGAACQATPAEDVSNSHMNDLTATAPLNVRAEPSTDARILGSFSAGEVVGTISVEGDWYKVKYGDQAGYCYGEYLK